MNAATLEHTSGLYQLIAEELFSPDTRAQAPAVPAGKRAATRRHAALGALVTGALAMVPAAWAVSLLAPGIAPLAIYLAAQALLSPAVALDEQRPWMLTTAAINLLVSVAGLYVGMDLLSLYGAHLLLAAITLLDQRGAGGDTGRLWFGAQLGTLALLVTAGFSGV